jgi:hypothetical protein
MSELILSDTGEQREIARKRAELKDLETRLAEAEPALATLQTQMRVFETRYLQIIGLRYDELAEIESEIAKLQGLLAHEDPLDSESLADDEVGCGQNRFHADKLKKLYREVARKFHPDLADDEHDRHHCHQLMIEANRAYEAGHHETLEALLEAGQVTEELAAASPELVWLTRRVAELKEQVVKLEAELADITSSELYRLKLRVENADALGVDLFVDLLMQVDRQIKKARNRLEALQGVMMTA